MKRYELRTDIPKEAREELKEHSDFISHLLYHRGIKTSDAANNFIDTSYDSLHDPFLLYGMDKAVDRILDAMKKDEKIVIYSDYDADGIPGAVILHDFFKKAGYENFFNYIPHRNKEGFGLNVEALDNIHEKGAKLMITVDCGIADIDEVAYAVDLGIDVIITDHHEPNGKVPPAFAIVNHKQEGCNYPEQILCGSGVAFKLVQGLLAKGDFDIPKYWEKNLLDMVGIATLSDMVPLHGENRALAKFGLMILRMSPRKGLHKLLAQTGTKQSSLTEDDIGFTISPRINAASRMGEPETAFKMLSTQDEVEAGILVKHLNEINDQRKGHVAVMVREIHKHLKNRTDKEVQVIAFGNPKWKPSLLGLAANKIAEEENKPVFLWGRGEGRDLKGSCRSNGMVSLIDLMNGVSKDIFEFYGGHNEAGGFVVFKDKVDFLEEGLNKSFDSLDTDGDKDPNWIDKKLRIEDITPEIYSEMDKLAPFGVGNIKPLFLFENAPISSVINFGKAKDHLKVLFNGSYIEAIAFFKNENSFSKKIEEGSSANIIGHIEKDTFAGKNRLRLRIVDVV